MDRLALLLFAGQDLLVKKFTGQFFRLLDLLVAAGFFQMNNSDNFIRVISLPTKGHDLRIPRVDGLKVFDKIRKQKLKVDFLMYDLGRFLQAQSYNYQDALQEIRNGRKQSCWMWYVFPQIAGLGRSSMAKTYELKNIEEAREYLAHPVLGSRLQEICEAALKTESDNASVVFGFPDDMKLCSSMTLFEQADPENPIYSKVLDKFFHGQRDDLTLRILKEQAGQVTK